MSALGIPVLINPDRAYWLSSIGADVIHSTIVVDTIDANVANVSTLNGEFINASTLNVSTLGAQEFDVSGMYVSTIRGNTAFFSTVTLASDLSGGVGFVRFSVDASGIQVDGDPIRFDNLVYLTSTINIIQVSTLVDTDIFGSNGYFSTLSTGNLSANVASLNQVNISSLYVSSLEGFDISGAEPAEWSLYPTLNSSVIFQPGFVLSNINNKLYFAGQEITDLSGGGANWSQFPAFTTVDMSNNRLVNLSTILFQDGGTLTSLTGNNLQYNGQNIQFGNASNITQWASYPAVSSVNMAGRNISNAATVTTSNAVILGDNITSGYTFTNSLGVGGTSLIPIASLTSGGDLSVRNIEVGDSVTSLADVNIYGATALPGDSALYVEGGVQFDGGNVHGFSAGVLPVAGINTGRIDMLQAGFNLLHPLVGAITTGAAMGITAGGALSLAGGGYVEMNTSTLQMINTTQGNKNTTIQAGFLTIDPDLGATSSIKLFNTLGGGVEIDGGGQGSLIGFSTVTAATLSSFELNVSTINGADFSSITIPNVIDVSAVNVANNFSCGQSTLTNIFTANRGSISTLFYNVALGLSSIVTSLAANNMILNQNLTGVFSFSNETRIENISSIQGGTVSTINLICSTINGAPPGTGGGNINNFSTLTASSFTVSTINAVGGIPIKLNGILQFIPPGGIDQLDFINLTPVPTLQVQANETNIVGTVLKASGFISTPLVSTGVVQAVAMSTQSIRVSTIGGDGGLPVKSDSLIQFTNVLGDGIDNVNTINLSANFPLTVRASTMVIESPFVRTTGFFSTPLVSTNAIVTENVSTVRMGISTILLADQSLPLSPSTLMNVGFAYNNSDFVQGITIENYVNQVDNFDINLLGNGDGVQLYAYGQNRSTTTNMFVKANEVTLDTNLLLISGNSDLTEISPTYVSTLNLNVSSIGAYDSRRAFTNNLMLSTMELYAGSTTLMYWSTVTTSSNINTSGYDVTVGLNGTFKIGASFQFISGGTSDEVEFFLLKNNAVISQSGGIIELENNAELVTYVESIETLVNGDIINIGCYTANSNVFVSTINGTIIQSPAVILTMYSVG